MSRTFNESTYPSTYVRVSVIGPLVLIIVVVGDHCQSGICTAGCPLQHLEVAIGVTHSDDRRTADESMNADRFADLVINRIDFRLFDN
ncbi:MAG: hypothetical protein KJO60_10955 [Desulfofustis sp.]|nr:hypothetical protein [Desulfofustis sp.]RZW26330.1 MAG: hypothetical protein EX260_01415 [Desulfobulbaceae bacterium]